MTPDRISARHFEIFLTMTTSRNMAEAAEKLGVSQAAVSKSLKGLERDTGLPLFRSVGGRLKATPEAERLLPFVQRALDQLRRAREMARALSGGDMGRITLAVSGPAVTALVPQAVERFRRERPGVALTIETETTSTMIARVAGNEVDLGIGTPPVRDIDARAVQLCTLRDLCQTALVAVLPPGDALGAKSVLRPADLDGRNLIALSPESATTQLVGAMFQQAVGHAPPAEITAGNAVAVCSLVNRGLGLGLVSPLVLAGGMFPDLIVRPFRPRITLRTCLYLPKLVPAPPQVDRLAACFAAAARDLSRPAAT